MTVSAMIRRGAVIPDLSSTTKMPVLAELFAALVDAGGMPREGLEGAASAVLARERLGTTGIGRGIAVPHAKHDAVLGSVAAFGRSGKGIEFESLDGEPVHLVLMILSNRQSPESHLRALASAARIFQDETLIHAVRRADTADEMLRILEAAELAATPGEESRV